MTKKIAVLMFNLGGPQSLDEVPSYLFNLFYDPAVLTLPNPMRWMLAKTLARRRTKPAQESYGLIGGRSPLLDNTEEQAEALHDAIMKNHSDVDIWCAPVMRYADPRADVVINYLMSYRPDLVVLLPMYPQFSTATSGSSCEEMSIQLQEKGYGGSIVTVCCYPDAQGYIEASADRVRQGIEKAKESGYPTRVMFSAHGLPKTIIKQGDPYQRHCELTAARIVDALNIEDLDWIVSYQSRVGPQQWITPFTDNEIIRAGKEGRALVVYPHAFVCEHSETLVELDIEYAELAHEHKLPEYIRVPTVRCHEAFINELASMVGRAIDNTANQKNARTFRLCSPNNWEPCDGGKAGCCPLTQKCVSQLNQIVEAAPH